MHNFHPAQVDLEIHQKQHSVPSKGNFSNPHPFKTRRWKKTLCATTLQMLLWANPMNIYICKYSIRSHLLPPHAQIALIVISRLSGRKKKRKKNNSFVYEQAEWWIRYIFFRSQFNLFIQRMPTDQPSYKSFTEKHQFLYFFCKQDN